MAHRRGSLTDNVVQYTGKNMVFLVGCPRSGTTWLQKLLASHAKIRSGEESHFFSLYVGPQLRSWYSQKTHHLNGGIGHAAGPPAYFEEKQFLQILKNYLGSLLGPLIETLGPDELFLEKTPSHALFIPEIKELLPDSRFIHLVRDPRDVVASMLAASRGWGATWAPTDAKIAAAMWVQHVQAVQAAAEGLAAHDFYQITYENLWKSTEAALKGVADFLQIPWSEEGIKIAIESNKADVMESKGTPIPVYGEVRARFGGIAKLPRGFIRNARPDGWRYELSVRQRMTVWRATRGLIEQMGYAWSLRDWL